MATSESILGSCLTALGRHAEAEALLLASYPVLRDEEGQGSPSTLRVLERLVTLYESWGKPDKAAEYRDLLQAAGEQ